jgi:hypothetical protein
MLYLFGTGAFKNDRKAVKVGYTATKSKKERETAYLLHNPLGVFLGWREGDKILEEKLHLRLRDYKVEFLDEWFYYEPNVEVIFGSSTSEINKWLWENRGELFYPLPKPGSLKRTIYEELSNLYGGTNIVEGVNF